MSEPPTLLSGYRVLDLAGATASYCGRFLADLGADVLKIEPPEGDPARAYPPFVQDAPGPGRSLSFLYRNAGKRCLRLDLEGESGRATFRDLLARADMVVDAFPAGYLAGLGLDPQRLTAEWPVVWASVTDCGQFGPRAGWRGSDLVDFALCGSMHVSGLVGEPPCGAPGQLAYDAAGVYAALALLIGLRHREWTGEGQWIDLSIEDAGLAGIYPWSVANFDPKATRPDGTPARPAGRLSPPSLPLLECRDGYVRFNLFLRHHWRTFVAMLGDPEVLLQPEWDAYAFRAHHHDVLRALALDLTGSRTKQEMFEEAQARGISLTAVKTPDEFVADKHAVARGLFVDLPHPEFGPLRVPGRPFRLSEAALAPLAPPADLDEPPAEWLGKSGVRGPRSEVTGARPHPDPARGAGTHPQGGCGAPLPAGEGIGPSSPRPVAPSPRRPLAGIRVLEFTSGAAGPELGMVLADFGAEVIKIESRAHLDFARLAGSGSAEQPEGSGSFQASNMGKRSVCLDMRTEGGRALVRRLIALADALVENNRVGVLERWGLDYPSVRAINPQLVMIRCVGFGLDGPYRDFASTGPALQALAGLTSLWRHPGTELPVGSVISYPDHLASKLGAALVLAALDGRRRTGKGQLIELCQLETVVALLGEPYLEWTVNGRRTAPLGNRSRVLAPQGAYPCAGDDRWLALSVTDDPAWRALCETIGRPDLAARYPALADRQAAHDAIDEAIAGWTRARSAEEAAAALQAAGVAAAPVQSPAEQLEDAHLRARRAIEEVDHPVLGRRGYAGNPIRLSRAPAPPRRPAPLLGEGTREICLELLGMSAAEYAAHEAAGVFY